MWRPDELAGEARRNLGPAHAALTVLMTLVLCGVLLYVLVQGQQALDQEVDRRAAGAFVWTATAADENAPLSGLACTRLGALPGVAAAGGVSAAPIGPLYAFDGSRTPVPAAGLTPGAISVFVPGAAPDETAIGGDLLSLAGAGPGQWLMDDRGIRAARPTLVVSDAPVGLLTSTVTVPVGADSPIISCWLRMEPGAVGAGGDLLSFAFPNGQALIAPFLPESAGVLTPAEQWRAAMAVQPWLVGGVLIAGAIGLTTWTRRTELAVYRTFGTTRAEQMFLTAVEIGLMAIPAAAASLLGAVVVAAARWHGVPPTLVGSAAAQASAALLVGVAAGTALTPLVQRGSLAETLRDR